MALRKLKQKLEDAELSGLERFMQQLEKGLRKNTHAIETGLGVTATGLLVRLIFGVGSGGSRWNDNTRYQVSWTVICFLLYFGFVWLSYLKDRMAIDVRSREGLLEANSQGLTDYQDRYTVWAFDRAMMIEESKGPEVAQKFLIDGGQAFGMLTAESINSKLALLSTQFANIKFNTEKLNHESRKKMDDRKPVPLTNQLDESDQEAPNLV